MSTKAIAKKVDAVQEIVQDLQAAKSFIIFEYHGLTAKNISSLRKDLHENGGKMHVLQNNILRRSLQEAGLDASSLNLTGPNAIALGMQDEIAPVKFVSELAKDFSFVELKGAFVEGQFIDNSKIAEIASIPGRAGLYSMFLSCLTSPIRGFLYALKAISETK